MTSAKYVDGKAMYTMVSLITIVNEIGKCPKSCNCAKVGNLKISSGITNNNAAVSELVAGDRLKICW